MAIGPAAQQLPVLERVCSCTRRTILIFAWLLLAATLVISRPSSAQSSLPTATFVDAQELVAAVLQQNAGIQALRAALDAAQARIETAGSLPDPQLSVAVAPQTLDGLDTAAGRRRGPNARFEISQAIPWPGTLGLRADAARKQAQAASQSVAALQLQLAAATRALYADWRYVARALEINTVNQQLIADLQKIAKGRYAAGLGRQQDVLQAAVQRQRLAHQAIKLKRLQRDVRSRLNRLLTRSPDAPIGTPSALPEPSAIPAYDMLRRQAIAVHPALRRIERKIAADHDRAALAHKAFYPDFKVFAGYNSLWDAPEKRWVVGVGVSLPWDRSKARAGVDQAQAKVRQSQFELKNQRAELLSQLDQAYAAVEEARHSIALYEQQLTPLAQANLSAARTAYGAGDGSFLEVITAEEKQLDVDLNLERARADYFAARARLARWTGGELDAAPEYSDLNLDVFFQ